MKYSTLTLLLLLTVHLKAQINTIQQRIESRDFSSVFQAWNNSDNLGGEDAQTTLRCTIYFFVATSFYACLVRFEQRSG